MTFRTTWVLPLCAVTLILGVSIPNTATAGIRRNFLEDRVQATLGLRGDQTFTFTNTSNQSVHAALNDGFQFSASYKPADYLHMGLVYTNFASTNSLGQNSTTGLMSRSRLGFTMFIATPWTQLSRAYQRFHYRGRIGFMLDMTGYEAKLTADPVPIILGRLREHQFFVSAEFGIKCFGDEEKMGVLFARLSYVRSVYGFSESSTEQYQFDGGSNNHIVIDLGLSI